MPVIPALRRLRQGDCPKFEASLGNIVKLCSKIISMAGARAQPVNACLTGTQTRAQFLDVRKKSQAWWFMLLVTVGQRQVDS